MSSGPFRRFGSVALRLLDDERLAELAAEGDNRAFGVVYERYGPALQRYCLSLLGDPDDAADAAQSSLAHAMAGLPGRRGHGPLRAWLFRIAHNEAMTVHRRRSPCTALESAGEVAGPSLDGQLERRERLATLVADVRDLPQRQRAALLMRELSGLSHAEIATALSVTPAAARQAIFEARVALHDFAEGRALDCGAVRRVISDRDARVLRARRLRAHLRSCPDCRAFRDAVRRRERDLARLFPPLPLGAGVLGRLLEAGAATAGGGGLGAAVPKLVAAGVIAATALGAAAEAPRILAPAPARGEGAVSAPPSRAFAAPPPVAVVRAPTVASRRSPGAPAPVAGLPAPRHVARAPVVVTTRPAATAPSATSTTQTQTPAQPQPATAPSPSVAAPAPAPALPSTPAPPASGTATPTHGGGNPAAPGQARRGATSIPHHGKPPGTPGRGPGNGTAATPGASQGNGHPDPGPPAGAAPPPFSNAGGNPDPGPPPASNAGPKGEGKGNAGANGHGNANGHAAAPATPSESPPA